MRNAGQFSTVRHLPVVSRDNFSDSPFGRVETS
jgi:hypothetical protein